MPSTAFSVAPFSVATFSFAWCAWPWPSSGVGREGGQFVFRDRLIAQAELDRHVVEPARRKAAVEMPHAGNDDPHDGHLDVGPRLVEHQEIIAGAPRDLDAGIDLLAGV